MQAPTWRLTLRAVAVLSWIVAALWLIFEPGYEPLLALLTGVTALVTSFATPDTPIGQPTPYNPSPAQRRHNRSRMLHMVRTFWVRGVLEQSLHDAVLLELRIQEEPTGVERPWDLVLQQPPGPSQTLPRDTRILEVFEEAAGSLLILGEPGSGKTTTLLELARDLVAWSEQDDERPIPVVFRLSSWAEDRPAIADWLVEELRGKYQVPRKVGHAWVDADQLVLLLDGLDEVEEKHRDQCVEAINDFRQEHMVDLAVCSRAAEYQILANRLHLQRAVVLQPLESQEIDRYLAGAGAELMAVRTALEHDTALRELSQSPLILSIMALAYRGMSMAELQHLNSVQGRREHLLATYVRRMLGRRGTDAAYSAEQSVDWLATLARVMSQNRLSFLMIEDLQPTWFGGDVKRDLAGLGLLVGAVFGGLFGLGEGYLTQEWFLPYPFLRSWSPCCTMAWLLVGITVGAAAGLDWLTGDIKVVERVSWTWDTAKDRLKMIPELGDWLGMSPILSVFTMLLCSAVTLASICIAPPGYGPVSGPRGAVFVFLFYALAASVFLGLETGKIEAKVGPNEGIRRSARNAVLLGTAVTTGLMLLIVSFLLTSGVSSPPESATGWLALIELPQILDYEEFRMLVHGYLMIWPVLAFLGSLAVGLFSALLLGGSAVVQHFALRVVIRYNGCLPWHIARFLDYATECILLRKVGGGYIFIHPVLQEYFASLGSQVQEP